MLPKGKVRGGTATTFIQILKSVVSIENVMLDKSVPTPFSSAGTLGT